MSTLTRSTRATPIRAITSSLSSRSSTPIPPASEIYDPQIKTVLRHRLIYNVFLHSAILSWLLTVLWTTWNQGGISRMGLGGALVSPFRPTILVLSATNWAVGALPAIILRKVYLTAARTSATSPSKTVHSAFAKQSTTRALLTYVASALCTVVLHAAAAYAIENGADPRLGLFVKSKKHPQYLNGRIIFLFFTQTTLACGFLLRNNLLDRFVFRWSAVTRPSPIAPGDILVSLLTVAIFTSLALPVASVFFGLSRTFLPLVYKIPLAPTILKPFTAHFLRRNSSWTIALPIKHVSLLVRAWFLAFTTLISWEAADVFFDAYIPRPISVSSTDALVAGITSSDRVLAYFAYAELAELAQATDNASASKRSALFADSKYSPNTLWGTVLRQSLLLLGRDYQLLLRRGVPPPPKITLPTLPAPTAIMDAPIFPSTPLIKRASVFRSGPTTPSSPVRQLIDGLAADGPLAQAVESVHVPAVFLSAEPSAILPPVVKNIASAGSTVAAGSSWNPSGWIRGVFVGLLVRYTPALIADTIGKVQRWWYDDRLSRVVDGCLQQRELDVLVIKVLSFMTCASLSEDQYGVVQRDIPKIIEALLSFLTAIEEYQVELSALSPPDEDLTTLVGKALEERVAVRIEVDRGRELLRVVGDELKNGIARIVHTFGDKLVAFKFAPRTAAKLQGFVDYA